MEACLSNPHRALSVIPAAAEQPAVRPCPSGIQGHHSLYRCHPGRSGGTAVPPHRPRQRDAGIRNRSIYKPMSPSKPSTSRPHESGVIFYRNDRSRTAPSALDLAAEVPEINHSYRPKLRTGHAGSRYYGDRRYRQEAGPRGTTSVGSEPVVLANTRAKDSLNPVRCHTPSLPKIS